MWLLGCEWTGKGRGLGNRMLFNCKAEKPPSWPVLRRHSHEHVGKPPGDAWWYPAEELSPLLPGRLRVEGDLLRDAAYSGVFCFEWCCWFPKFHLKRDTSIRETVRVKALIWREHDSLILWAQSPLDEKLDVSRSSGGSTLSRAVNYSKPKLLWVPFALL